MGVFEQFPYANMHEMNLDWLLKLMKELDKAMETFKATESLKFADPIIWDITTQYEKSTIVLDPTGNAYLSLQAVPAGVQLNNEEYWLEIFNFTEYTRTANKNLTVNVETNTTRATTAHQVNDWLIWNDVLYKVTSPIAIDDALIVAPAAGSNIVHFTVEEFIKAWIVYAQGIIQQYKADIDASELAFTNHLQQQFDQVLAGVTVDSEVINARVGWDGYNYTNLGVALRTQITDLNNIATVIAEGYNMTDYVRPMITNHICGLSGTTPVAQYDSAKASLGGGLYFCNRDFVFVNDSVKMNAANKIQFVIVTFDASLNIINNTGWIYAETYFIPKDSCSYFLIQMRYDNYPTVISDLDVFASYLRLYVSREACDKNSEFPNMFMVGGANTNDYRVIEYRPAFVTAVFAYLFKDYKYIHFSNMMRTQIVCLVSDTSGNTLLNTGWLNYPSFAIPVLGNLTAIQLTGGVPAPTLTANILKNLADSILVTAAIPDRVHDYPMHFTDPFKVSAHRIGNICGPENTAPSLRLSYLSGFRCFETDVQLTSDNVPVLCHDNTINRVSDGTGAISDYTFSELQAFDFGSWKGALWTGTKILALESLINFCKKHDCYMNLELKAISSWDSTKFHIVYNMLKAYNMLDHVVWNNNGAAGYSILQMQLAEDPTLEVYWGLDVWDNTHITTAANLLTGSNKVTVFTSWSNISSNTALIAVAKTLGLNVATYSINSNADNLTESDFTLMLYDKIDGVITEQPSFKFWADKTDF